MDAARRPVVAFATAPEELTVPNPRRSAPDPIAAARVTRP
jgi:hypothetical protein